MVIACIGASMTSLTNSFYESIHPWNCDFCFKMFSASIQPYRVVFIIIHLAGDGFLGCFYFLAIMNTEVTNVEIQVSLW